MSGASRPCCHVCLRTGLETESDYVEGTLMERTERCPHCRLYEYEYSTGSSRERLGFVILDRTLCRWDTDDDGRWRREQDERKRAIEDARTFWADPGVRPFLDRWLTGPAEDRAPLLVLADWLDDRGTFPEQAAGIRTLYGPPVPAPAPAR